MPEDKDRGGAGPGEVEMAKGKSKGQDTRDNGGNRYYLLVDPRPGEAPDYDDSALVQCTGTGRSPAHPIDMMDNALYSQQGGTV